MITREDFTRLMIQYGFARFPRAVGLPIQTIIRDFDTFILFFKLNNGRFPLYTSSNSYWDFDKYGNPTNVYYEKLFFDLDEDTGYTVEDALKNCQVIAEFCKDNKIPFATCFSGNGFHFYIFFKPKMRTIDRQLTQEIRSVANYLKEELNLKTANLVVAEPKRLVRIPLSTYVTGKEIEGWTVKDWYCIPLTYDQLMNNKLKDIMLIAKHPRLLPQDYKVAGKKIKMKDFIKDYKIDVKRVVEIESSLKISHTEGMVDYSQYDDNEFFKIVNMLIPLPCISRMLRTKNPPHFIRFSACAFLKKVISYEEAIAFFDKLAYDAEWNDRHNKIVRDNQIKNIYRNLYTEYSCDELVKHKVCVGSCCVRYKNYLKKNKSSNVEVSDDS